MELGLDSSQGMTQSKRVSTSSFSRLIHFLV
jgi:hypothetical protein